MTLAFSTKLAGKPSYFVEKIWESILRNGTRVKLKDFIEYGKNSIPEDYTVGTHKPKLHTIRKDEPNRWKSGNDIHMVINNRTSKRLQFAPILKTIFIQKFEIKYYEKAEITSIDVIIDDLKLGTVVFKDCVFECDSSRIDQLAINDGFDSTEAFFNYFDTDFKGKIIHWTKHRY